MSRGELRIYSTAKEASIAGAESFVARAKAAVESHGRFAIALSGGTTPLVMYGVLAEEPLRSRVPWEAVHFFWGDERCVPPGHPRSNFGTADRALVSRVPISPANVHRIHGEYPPQRAAEEYAAELEAFFGTDVPRFDLLHLGLGTDGHTASLFPFDLDVLMERTRPVRATLHPQLGEHRITLTPPALNAAVRTEFLVTGAEKADITRAIVRGALDPFRLPAQLIRPATGEPVWLLTREVAHAWSARTVLASV
jgi:6-phosphogluconolactonase